MQTICVSAHTGHKWLPFKLLEVERDLFQVNKGHLSVLQHGLLISLRRERQQTETSVAVEKVS